MYLLKYFFKFWWFFALFSLGYGTYLYFQLTELETVGGEIEVNIIIVGVYQLLGKWGVVGFFGFGAFVAFPALGYVYHHFLRDYFAKNQGE